MSIKFILDIKQIEKEWEIEGIEHSPLIKPQLGLEGFLFLVS